MMVFAIFGILVNGLAVLRLRRGTSLNEKVVSWHLLEDVLGWIVILVVSIIMMFVDLPILDPILSILLTMFVLYNVVKNLREILNVFLQGVPKGLSVSEMESIITGEPGVVSVHHTHIWTLEGQKHHLSTHIVIPDDLPREEIIAIKQHIKEVVKGRGIEHVTVEVDFESEDCTSEFCD
ncbi:MAG TPA: cation diffusion facilitator family transporter, partial [Clostridiaceae bacterium]|nr:cation diffusion facilitator family transporter [Clostridiaceae bacterium]